LDKPPYEAYGITCGITFTFGGLRTNDDGAVMDTELNAIPGLYAAGELVGGLFSFNYPGGTGLMSGAILGRLAGASAAAAGSGRPTARRLATKHCGSIATPTTQSRLISIWQ
jgi:tricarballylate dehydrogenase